MMPCQFWAGRYTYDTVFIRSKPFMAHTSVIIHKPLGLCECINLSSIMPQTRENFIESSASLLGTARNDISSLCHHLHHDNLLPAECKFSSLEGHGCRLCSENKSHLQLVLPTPSLWDQAFVQSSCSPHRLRELHPRLLQGWSTNLVAYGQAQHCQVCRKARLPEIISMNRRKLHIRHY